MALVLISSDEEHAGRVEEAHQGRIVRTSHLWIRVEDRHLTGSERKPACCQKYTPSGANTATDMTTSKTSCRHLRRAASRSTNHMSTTRNGTKRLEM